MQDQSNRALRVAELIRRELTTLLHSEVKDPRVSDVIIYDVVVTNDLSLAKVYFSPMDIQQDATKMQQGLDSARGYLRTQLGKILTLRRAPELRFIVDETEANSERIEQLIQRSQNKS